MDFTTIRLSFSDWAAGRCRSTASDSTNISPARDLPLLECLDDVAGLEVLEVGQADAALEALPHLAGVVLEALEGRDGALPDDDAVAQEADLGAAGDDARLHVAAGDGADPRDAEDLPHLGVAGDDLLELGGEEAHHGLLDVLQDLVDDLVGADLDVRGVSQLPASAVGDDVPADDGGVRGDGEGDVVLG